MSMTIEKALEAMKRDDWNIVIEMLDKGELSTEDTIKEHPEVRYSR